MKFTTNVSTLQSVVSNLSKGVGNDKTLPITSLVGIECLPDKRVEFTVTDYVNYLTMAIELDGDDEDYEEGYATVSADMFIKLVSKCSNGEAITITKEPNCLTVECCGVYKLELVDDGSGDVVHFTNPGREFTEDFTEYTLDTKTLYAMVGSCKQALHPDKSEVYSNYLVSSEVVSTDRTRAVFVKKDIVGDKEDILLDSTFVDLLMLFGDDVTLKVAKDCIYATNSTGTIIVFSKADSSVGDFNTKGTKAMLSIKFPSMCKVSKAEVLSALNRIGLFCAKYEDNALRIDFKDGLMVLSSDNSSAIEEIEYLEYKDVEPFSLHIDITRLQAHLKGYNSDTVELYFGSPKCIKLEDTDITQIIALVQR